MKNRTIKLYGGGELVVGRGERIYGLAFFESSKPAFALEEAEVGELILALEQLRAELRDERAQAPGQQRLGDPAADVINGPWVAPWRRAAS